MKPQIIHNVGGRSEYFKGSAGDCVTRAIAISFGMDYKEVYDELTARQKHFIANTRSKKFGKAGTARNGIYKEVYNPYLEELGAEWTALMGIGTGCQVHVHPEELPSEGTYILSLSKHLSVWKDGAIHDTSDPSRNGTRCVYGYWKIPTEIPQS